ncbi:UvrD-helicase domain-containing protein, partial [Polaribacter sp.]|nr:UvrD-helicase domain-containing protein [Polaribacter sp.]
MKQGVDSFNILSLTFTNKAAKEMKARIASVVGASEAKNLWMGTFHSVFARILRSEADKLGFPSNFTIYDTQDSVRLISAIIKEMGLDKERYKPKQILGRISSFKNSLITVKAYYNNADLQEADLHASRPKVGEIYRNYVDRCFKAGAMDFDDLLLRTNELLARFPETLAKYQDRFRYIMVDEYQDTNHSQYIIVRALADKFGNICVVGDDSQSIYSFRGANIQNILNFQKDYPDVKTFKLEQNYRSTSNIVNAANSVIAKNKTKLDKEVWTSNDAGEAINVMRTISDGEEGRFVAQSIWENQMNHQLTSDVFCVLYRTNSQSRAIEDALRKKGIDYKIYGGISFYQRKEIKDYFDWQESLKRIPSHRLLAILRAENEGFIRLKIAIDSDNVIQKIADTIIRTQNTCAPQIQLAIKDAFKRLLFPSLANEALSIAKEKADEAAILVFSKNLKQLLLGAPLGEKRVLAIDPGFKSGCKIVCLNAQGGLEHNETIFPHAPQNQAIEAIKKINFLVNAHKIEAIAIGNGTASRETEQLVKKIQFTNNVAVFVVSEAGASIYSASKIARDEFPNDDVTVRGSVSIGRRLQDPLAELVKIDAKSIGVGQYQHDVDQTKLKKSLVTTVESCVNTIGVNINTASEPLLSSVSGIGPKIAENIVNYRNENGSFTSRISIKKVPRLGGKAFEQAAGFLRIKNSKNPLDDSGVHPESYGLV